MGKKGCKGERDLGHRESVPWGVAEGLWEVLQGPVTVHQLQPRACCEPA